MTDGKIDKEEPKLKKSMTKILRQTTLENASFEQGNVGLNDELSNSYSSGASTPDD